MKGLDIEIGDQELLANKMERGKRKVADRWESTVYTVVDRKPDTHTYRIHNPATGRKPVNRGEFPTNEHGELPVLSAF